MTALDLKLIDLLEERYGPLWPWPENYFSEDPFKNLIITVLSQNTSEANCLRAYRGLTAKFKITPETLAYSKEEEIKKAIRSGGLYNVKARRIKEISRVVLKNLVAISLLFSLFQRRRRRRG